MVAERLSLAPDSLVAQSLVMADLIGVAMEPALAIHGIKPSTFDLLSTIHAAGPAATQAEIARRMGIRPPTLTEALRGLNHLVEQVPSPTDQRVKNLRLTDKGGRALAAAIKSVESVAKVLAAGIEKDQLRDAIEIMKKANRLLSQSLL